ncbi:MAG TPA: DUF1330 domain-containing protein [Acidimicrobiia bacterium]|jgi:uncharacterized protein (DUF1330 family)|nr:DUF1330 domain-containing protein [Acidimicrobiia bacterium]HIL04945.1 DUF1330 domain-containing protein [Acidimicrobiia bacterium]
MTAYIIFQGDITDPDRYEAYKPLAAESVAEHDGRYLVRGGECVSLEGAEPASRTVILEFKSMDAATRWYESSSYSKARPIRQAASEGSMYLVEG